MEGRHREPSPAPLRGARVMSSVERARIGRLEILCQRRVAMRVINRNPRQPYRQGGQQRKDRVELRRYRQLRQPRPLQASLRLSTMEGKY